MKISNIMTLVLIPFLSLSSLCSAEPEEKLSLTALDEYETPYRYMTPSLSWNLGPTGARGWVRGYKGGKLFGEENGKEILITWVDPKSPADGKLKPHDVILGVNGKEFDRDARICLGEAIIDAERKDGKLTFKCWRPSMKPGVDGEIIEVTVIIPALGLDCSVLPVTVENTKAIREPALKFLVDTMPPNGFDDDLVWLCSNTLYLLAHGRTEDLDLIRRNIQKVIEATQKKSKYGPWNWQKGSCAILLSEYFLATGDTSVLPALNQLGAWLAASQSYMGGFGHGGPYGGYGHVGLPGMFSATGLALMKECGITKYNKELESARKFFERGTDLGMMSYGGNSAGTKVKTNYGDNGKCGLAAIMFDVLGDRDRSRIFGQMECALGPYFETGHTGNYWSLSWGSLGAGTADAEYRKYYFKGIEWWYALARTWRGGFIAQPWTHHVEGHRGMIYYVHRGAEANTGGLALWYCRPLKSLRILGGTKSVFSQSLDGVLAKSRQAIYDKDYNKCLKLLEDFESNNEKQKQWANQLRKKAELALDSIKLTKSQIRKDVKRMDFYTAERRLNALKLICRDTDFSFTKTEIFPEQFAAGKEYYELMKPERTNWENFHRAPGIALNRKKRKKMETLSKREDTPYYSKLAKKALADWPAEFTKETILVNHTFEVECPQKLYLGKGKDADKGINYTYYEFEKIPKGPEEIRKLTPVKSGVLKGFDLGARKRKINFAFDFKTFIDIPRDGEYKFTLASDDGGWLFIDGRLSIDNGGLHGMDPKSDIFKLSKGRHELELVMFQGKGGLGLMLDVVEVNSDLTFVKREVKFDVDDTSKCKQLKLRVKTLLPVTVYLNGEVICRMPRKRPFSSKLMDPGWTLWEEVSLQPKALKLLKKGANSIYISSPGPCLGSKAANIEIELQGIRQDNGME